MKLIEEVKDCRDCPMRQSLGDATTSWQQCSHPASPPGIDAILWRGDDFKEVPVWCPLKETFTCEKCEQEFTKCEQFDPLHELRNSPWHIPGDGIGVICEDCFVKFKAWFDTLTEEDHRRIRAEAKKERGKKHEI